ncbi:MAG: efflux RND transporter permease subunit, partial [Thermoguttaceae bacterium]
KVDPPLTEQESGFIRTIQRLQSVLAGKDANPPLAEKDLTPQELDLLHSVQQTKQRLYTGMGLKSTVPPEPRDTVPPLTDEELERIQSIQRRAALRAAKVLREEEYHRIQDIRSLVIASVNNQPVRVEDVVEGGRVPPDQIGKQGVVVSNLTRLGRIGYWKADRERAPGSDLSLADVGHDESDVVQCIVLMRKGEDTLPAVKAVKKKVEEVNDPSSGRRLPGVQLEPYLDRTNLINVTTDTVIENLLTGIALVVVILLMHLNNVRTSLIVAINIPLALLFAFSVLYLRGKSANLLSIGAVDFGIIVDSSVIIAENIYRHLATGQNADLPLKDRIFRAAAEIDRPLLFSTLIMVCAFIPLFSMQGAEGALFGPMAQTYASALAGALVLAVTLTPVLCLLFFRNLKPVQDNFFVRFMKYRYLRQLERCLKHRYLTVLFFGSLIAGTACLAPYLGTEFMPELEEGNLWIRGTGPLNQTLERNVEIAKQARTIMASYPEVETVVSQSGRPDDGTDTEGYEGTEYFVPVRPFKDWPAVVEQSGWRRWLFGPKRPRTKVELTDDMDAELKAKIPGVNWNFSQDIRDNVMESLSGIKGDNSVKIMGPDIDQLELLAAKVKNEMDQVKGIEDVGIFHIRGQTHMEFRVDPEKCQRWGVMTADVNNVIASALGANSQNNMVEGEKLFPISIRWPERLRGSETAILDIPVDIGNNSVALAQGPNPTPNPQGFGLAAPAFKGSQEDSSNQAMSTSPRLRLRDLVSPVAEGGKIDPKGQYERAGAEMIYREQGERLVAIKFSVRNRDLGGAVNEAKARIKDLLPSPYRAVWSGEFEQMEDAQGRLLWIIPMSLGLIFILLYSALHSWLDAVVVISNVFDLAIGGVWAMYLTGTVLSISAAVGFISLFGVAIMDGLLMISYFNTLRHQGKALKEAIMEGAAKRMRPVMMTAMTALFGLLPAAFSTKIGSQTQRPLAIVVVGGMAATILLTRYLMPVLYSFYGHREPPEGSGDLAH